MNNYEPLSKRLSETWENPQPLSFDPSHSNLTSGYSSTVMCPSCGENALHVNLAGLIIWPDDDDYDSPAGTRGEFILLPLDCEHCPGKRALVIANHKGDLYVTGMDELLQLLVDAGWLVD